MTLLYHCPNHFDLLYPQNPFTHHIITTAKMAYQNSSPQIVTSTQSVTGISGKAPISKWWPIGFFCSALFFFVLGAWNNCDYYDDYCFGNVDEWDGGIACIAISALLKLVFWVLLIIWCLQRRHALVQPTIVYVNAQSNAEAGTVQKTQPVATVYNAREPKYIVQPAPECGVAAAQVEIPRIVEKQVVPRYCGQCETCTTSPFCSRCGSQVPM